MGEFVVPYAGVSNRLGVDEVAAVTSALRGETLSMGPLGKQFENRFAEMLGATHAHATNSCTTALFLAAQVLELQPGDEVITTPQTFWVTTWPLQSIGCTVRFADIDPDSLNIDPASVAALVTPRTRSIWVVHHGGRAVDMDPIMDIARKHRLSVVEDCAHAPGATYKGRRVGTIGNIGCFSFHSLKNMTTGEGGAFVTSDDHLAAKARDLGTIHTWGSLVERQTDRIGPYAQPKYYRDPHVRSAFTLRYRDDRYLIGNNYRMSEVTAALGLAQLQKLDQLNKRRQEIAEQLDQGLAGVPGITTQRRRPEAPSIYHLYTIFYDAEVAGRPKDDFIRLLEQAEGIEIVLRYFPIHLLPEFRALGHEYGECPVAETAYFEHQIQLPIYAQLTDQQVDHLIGGVRRAVETLAGSAA
ncbi:MAG TPA: DegT/DnrJ/EryC1/StrS family aminotransferase [Kribbella sp.]